MGFASRPRLPDQLLQDVVERTEQEPAVECLVLPITRHKTDRPQSPHNSQPET